MFRCYLKTCSDPLEQVIRVNHCLQVFSERVNSSRCRSIRSPLIPCAVCILLHDVLWMIMHCECTIRNEQEEMNTYTNTPELLSAPVGQCDWGLSQSHFIPLVYGTIMIVVEELTWQSKSHSTCLSEELCASVEFDLTIDLSIQLNIKKRSVFTKQRFLFLFFVTWFSDIVYTCLCNVFLFWPYKISY